jgi:hypothetical protein
MSPQLAPKSGKLTTKPFSLHAHVKTKDFFAVKSIYLGRGQTNPGLYNKIFVNDNGKTTYNLKIIPPKCMPLCQPYNIYFYKQSQIFMKHLLKCVYFLCEGQEICGISGFCKGVDAIFALLSCYAA